MSESPSPEPTSLAEFLDRHGAAAFLGCSPDTITRLIAKGRIKAGDVGTGQNRHYRISRAELLAFQQAPATALLPASARRRTRTRKPPSLA
jgi:excisionase family DNA binding protein